MVLMAFAYPPNLFTQNAPCNFDETLHSQMEDPLYLEQMEMNENHLQEMMENSPQALMNGEAYSIPVVFHVIHKGEPIGVGSNLSDSRLLQALTDLNDQFRNGSNDVGIEFCLAKRDPQGAATSGINRVSGFSVPDYTSIGITTGAGSNDTQVKALSNWLNTEYLNIWIVHAINGTASGVKGYASFPGTVNGVDGIVLATFATGISSNSTSIAHEAGHFFNLYHTFEGGDEITCPINSNCNLDGDRICNIPPHLKITGGCDETGINACDGGSSNELFVHNLMGYSNNMCRDEFINEQIMRMRGVLMILRSGLLSSIGCEPVCTSVNPLFTTSPGQFIEQGETISFTNATTGTNTYTWIVEGQLFTSTDFIYEFLNPGMVTVCLLATNGTCVNRKCIDVNVQRTECSNPILPECEFLINGDLSANTVLTPSLDDISDGEICNWLSRHSTPYFCHSYFGLNNRFNDSPSLPSAYEGVVAESEMTLIDGVMYELSFEYYVVPTKLDSDNPSLEVGLAQTADQGLSFPSDNILLELNNLPFDGNEEISNMDCHDANVVYHSASLCFTYNATIGKYLYFINTSTGISSTIFIKNMSVQGCGACDVKPACGEGLDFETLLTDCSVKLTAITDNVNADLIWDFGNGVTATGTSAIHEYPFGGTFDICLTEICDPENAFTICHEVVIPESCHSCDTLDTVMIGLCDETRDSIIADTIYTNFSFEVPNDYGPCQDGNLFVTSEDVAIYINSFEIIDTFPDFDLITVALAIVLPPDYDLTIPGTTGFITLCGKGGGVVCRTFELLESGACDQCLPEVFSDAVCAPKNTGSDLYYYTGTVVVELPFDQTTEDQLCDFSTSELGFEIISTTVYPSDAWFIDYVITSTNPNLEETSVLLCFDRENITQYCVPLTITVKETCDPLPPDCVRAWNKKQMTCSRSDSDNVIFNLPNMSVPRGSFEICDEGLFGSVDEGTVVINSASTNGGTLLFDADIIIPVDDFVDGGQYDVRLFLCDTDGNLVCFLFPLELNCRIHALRNSNGDEIENSSTYSNKYSIKDSDENYVLQPNPATDRLIISSPPFDEKTERVIRLQDCMGRLIQQYQMTADKLEINTSNFHSGIYFVTILENGSPAATKKLVILH